MRILRGLSGRLLPCGCLVGVYETYDDIVVTLVDHRDAACTDPSHVAGKVIPEFAVIAADSVTSAIGNSAPHRESPL